ncbi:VanW family protein [Streptomyces asoensis]|uniref:Vanomycin resistance protein VanB n=1 Tax=Streptomyces asoensis TaxID=249586 RepID=A0ABQ3RVJ2_9ACTN|nr:VanW family protein [Streptomyces asoensis]GGQ93428.1 vanomycin resistance protein VanB [Streptomyces asoensis]GHI59838.1 vanomycin resistance protein VanB [Streptomyces asoensis]
MRLRTASVPPLVLAGGVLTVGVGALYLTGVVLTSGEIESGTTVRGVDIGGLSRTEAVRRLDAHLAAAGPRELTVRVGGRTATVDPRSAGIGFDAARTVDRAARNGSDPVGVVRGLFRTGGGDEEPVVRVDEAKTRATLEKLAKTLDQGVREGAVGFTGARVRQVAPSPGHTLDVDAAVGTLRASFLRGATGEITDLPARETRPKVTEDEVRRAVRDFARPAVSAPVTLTADGRRVTVAPAVLGEHLTMRPDGAGRLVPELDVRGLRAAPSVARPLAAVTTTPENAVLGLDGDRAVVARDARTGVRITDKALGKAVLPLLTRSGGARTGEVAVERTRPEVTRESAPRLGLKERMSSFTVHFERAAYRTKNIGRAAHLIDGSVVLPGETWSFNRTVGQRTEANGFGEGIMILGGEFTKAPGGGVSTMATTMYNAMFFAGVRPVEHGAHSFYIERYPEGREATVAWGSLDLKFANDSGHALYVRARATDTSVTVDFLGTRKYDEVRSVTGPRTRVTQPRHKVGTGEQCVPQTPLEGFDVTVQRVFYDGGREVRREPFRTHYTPRDEITCEPAR